MTARERAMVKAAFYAWLSTYYMAEQHPLTIEALWAAWQEGYTLARQRKGRK